jgi:hypothetical protein
MSDLGDGLRSTIEGAAVPVTLDELASRDRGLVRSRRRAPWRTFVAGVAATALVIVGAVVVVNLDDDDPPTTHIAAPTVAVGDIDLAVLSTSFDGDGARGPIDTSVVDAVRAVPGVAGAQGAMQRFVDVSRPGDTFDTQLAASERSAIAISWEEGAPLSFSTGGPPQGADEIAINQSLAAQYGVGVGDPLVVRTGGPGGPAPVREINPDGTVVMRPVDQPTVRVSGVFVPSAGDVDDINLVVMRADDLAAATHQPQFDRIDIVADDHVPVEDLLDRVSAALPSGTMAVPPSVVGFGEQLRSELEIQRAYHWLLDPDHARAQDSTLNPATGAGAETNLNSFNQNLQSIRQTEFRVGRVSFIDDVTALVAVRLYFSGSAWTGVPDPTIAVAERVDGVWRISQMCNYSVAGGAPCAEGDGPPVSAFTAPPNGWNAVDSVPGVADAFRVLADPSSTVEQRVAAVDRGAQLRDAIEAGARSDATHTNVSFNVSGARLVDPTHAQILYSLIADGEPHLETPYPLVGNAVLVDGAWKAASRFACGLTALATLACPPAAALPTTTTAPTTTSTTRPTVTTGAPSTVPPTTDPDSVEVPTTRLPPTSTAP